ncbi:hypothetical protein TL16_g11401 [Triparma laevis f. inornata]|uniref:Uncharacterized protein n=1 Tax=Triparma laevis f. inornata TaxID=1714386 RepID=A0A9W7ETD7_9STRA|nr:hypothetical protein TL16_g11401 [Triparma laevis f. inornata]
MSDSGPLKFQHIFGLQGSVKNNVHFVEEGVIIYPSGASTVVYRSDTREMDLIPTTSDCLSITSLSVSPSRRFIAVAESTSERGIVNIYDANTMRRRKMLDLKELESKRINWVVFSADTKQCLTLGGSPDYLMCLWNVEKAVKVITSISLASPNGAEVYKATFCPADPSVICVTGQGVLRFFRVLEGGFRPVTLNIKREPQDYTCQCWLPEDRVVIAADSGELLIIENFEFKCVLSSSPTDGKRVGCIVAFSKGFVVGGTGGIRIYEKSDDSREFYKLGKVFQIKTNPTCVITSMSVSPSEDVLLCSTSDHQLYTFSLSNTDILKEDVNNFDVLMAPFHGPGESQSAKITGLDTCIWKPLVVSCGLDRSVRVWNYVEKTMELMKVFDEEALSVALHPSGLYVLIAFTSRIRLCSILMDDIRPIRDLTIKSCKKMTFSHGGQYFAVANNTTVQVYGTYSCDLVSTMRGHNGKVRSVVFKDGDKQLMTCGLDGGVFVWNVITGAKEKEDLSFGNSFTAGCADGAMQRGYLISTDNKIKEYDLNSMQLKNEVLVEGGVGETCYGGKFLFCGGSGTGKPGGIKAFKIGGSSFTEDCDDFQVHSGPVSCLALSHDGTHLFLASEDGSLAIFGVPAATKSGERQEFAEEILVTKGDLEEKSGEISRLHGKVEELSLNNDYQLRLKDMNYKEKIKEVSDKFMTELKNDSDRYAQLMEEKKEMEGDYEERLRSLKVKHSEEFKELEGGYNTKINTEVQRFEQLVSEREEQNRKWDEENQALVDSHTEFLQDLTEEYDKKVEAEQNQQKNLSEAKDSMVGKFTVTKDLVEEDAEFEVEELKSKYEGKLNAERKATLRLRGENGFMKKKYDAMIKDVSDQREEINALHEKEKELHESIKGLEKDIQGHKKEIREREETIVDKEKRIYDLKKKNQELEKFKFVLDYKIKELKRQIEPRENEIGEMKNMIEEMDLELEQYHKSNSALDLMIGELRLKMDGMNREILAQKKTIDVGNEFIKRFRRDLHVSVQKIGKNKELKDSVTNLYKQYAQNDLAAGGGGGGDGKKGGSGGGHEVQNEYNRQREHLERSVESLKRKIGKDVDLHNTDHARLIRENVALTKEINELRRESKDLSLQGANMEHMYGGDGSGLPVPMTAGSIKPGSSVIAPTPPTNASSRRSKPSSVGMRSASGAGPGGGMEGAFRELEEQSKTILSLEERIESLRGMMGAGGADGMGGLGIGGEGMFGGEGGNPQV